LFSIYYLYHSFTGAGSYLVVFSLFFKLHQNMRKPRLPWKRGPRAYEIGQRAHQILENINASRRGFYSLRRTAKLFGVSTQPIRDWIRLGQLKREGPHRQISRAELVRFLNKLFDQAEPYDSNNYILRIERNRKNGYWQWRKLSTARFEWPKEYETRTPSQLARLIGCHPSLIIKAIYAGRVRGFRRTPHRWAIKRKSWSTAFFSSFL
jgi:hypothetical protein